ncbi:hypothetical protein FQV27_01150 [Paracoccus aurantiacus]|uniref:AAA+ family ATPase n=1 Tax=Paracoccus aurantiacus TaxID=2599412 RepID=A0A5C6S7M3_9RHOB|nr:hypothetical protein [Paracoccus aurantiacus]TXB70511.1 hypothetical protein FQV27_01150 [Paracoccus aurantiacus]
MIRSKTTLVAALSLMLSTPLAAQEWQMPRADDAPLPDRSEGSDPYTTPDDGGDGGLDDLGRDLEGMMEGMFNRLQPHLEDLGNELAGTVDEYRPALGELSKLIDDMSNYERPERLPNGDIVIRRRADAPPPPPVDELQRLLPNDRPGRPSPRDGTTPTFDLPQTEL